MIKKGILIICLIIFNFIYINPLEIDANKFKLFYSKYIDKDIVLTNVYISSEMRNESKFKKYFVVYLYTSNRELVGTSWFSDGNCLNTVVDENLALKWLDYCEKNFIKQGASIRIKAYGKMLKFEEKPLKSIIWEYYIFNIDKIEILSYEGKVIEVINSK